MSLSTRAINTFLMVKLPAAYFCGVRAKSLTKKECTTSVRLRWINQNPFKSMFWAVQGMAAELSTGALVMQCIRNSERPISMLVATNKATFSKKAKGRITFTCSEGEKIQKAIDAAISTGEGQTCWMHAEGIDSDGALVSQFAFEWTVKVKTKI
ncbi:DUF4442 domain-containing protein [Altibacter sp. HG106]|uniref:DUF4442 domain-containing protein n=1 Tax=Altibacter sp. HG106 TaxID=3023937 RepID=UPI0023501521|nr:DUF4442 domain-containing protein [Altibacter sp. HG106]MDC7993847.1 DUF4442 domain-containing protein [Altibacter sp. HG106]